eukprot:COSAG02_NODE_4549_length_5227_cov_25.421412_1_plen_86_part_00
MPRASKVQRRLASGARLLLKERDLEVSSFRNRCHASPLRVAVLPSYYGSMAATAMPLQWKKHGNTQHHERMHSSTPEEIILCEYT